MRRELTEEYSSMKAAKFLLNEIYIEEKIDFGKFITLELAKKHTWKNLINSKEKRALFCFSHHPAHLTRLDVVLKSMKMTKCGSMQVLYTMYFIDRG